MVKLDNTTLYDQTKVLT